MSFHFLRKRIQVEQIQNSNKNTFTHQHVALRIIGSLGNFLKLIVLNKIMYL